MKFEDINTEGEYDFRMKPGIIHAAETVCRAVEELQKIMIAQREEIARLNNVLDDMDISLKSYNLEFDNINKKIDMVKTGSDANPVIFKPVVVKKNP